MNAFIWPLRFPLSSGPLPEQESTGEVDGELAPIAESAPEALRKVPGALVLLAFLAVIYTAYFAQGLLIPIALAAFFATALSTPVAALTRGLVRLLPQFCHALTRPLAALVVVVCGLAAAVGVVASLAPLAITWLERAPALLKVLTPRIKQWSQEIEALGGLGTRSSETAPPQWINVWDALSATPGALIKGFSILLLVYFFLVYGDALLRRLVELSPTFTHKRKAVAIVRAIQTDTSRYLLITSLVNVSLGVATGLALWLLKVPDPALWGALAALLNFIPYIGALVSLTLIGLISTLHFGLHAGALLPPLVFLGLCVIEGQFISPTILGARLSVSPVAILLWLMLWGWLWGVAGVILGVPLLMTTKILCERFDGTRGYARAIEPPSGITH